LPRPIRSPVASLSHRCFCCGITPFSPQPSKLPCVLPNLQFTHPSSSFPHIYSPSIYNFIFTTHNSNSRHLPRLVFTTNYELLITSATSSTSAPETRDSFHTTKQLVATRKLAPQRHSVLRSIAHQPDSQFRIRRSVCEKNVSICDYTVEHDEHHAI
jgi:hypothetical protein